MAARGALGAPVNATATGLAPATTYYWAACFDNPVGSAGIEDCSPVRTFTTAASVVPPSGGGTTPGTDGGGGGPQGDGGGGPQGDGGGGPISDVADRIKPTASIKVVGKLKRGKRVTLSVSASDPSGIRSVTIKVGSAKAVARRKVAIKLPRRKGTVKVVVTVTDGAGNVTRLTRTLRVR
jgi:hypothetical protein